MRSSRRRQNSAMIQSPGRPLAVSGASGFLPEQFLRLGGSPRMQAQLRGFSHFSADPGPARGLGASPAGGGRSLIKKRLYVGSPTATRAAPRRHQPQPELPQLLRAAAGAPFRSSGPEMQRVNSAGRGSRAACCLPGTCPWRAPLAERPSAKLAAAAATQTLPATGR